MLWPIRWLFWIILRAVLSCRYWLTLEGTREVFRHPGPYLILPNHPAYADPPNLLVRLWPWFKMRPMLLETNFQNPVLAPIAWLLRAINVPDVTTASAESRQRAEEAVQSAAEALKAGANVILWPSGRLQRGGIERIGGTRSVADILSDVPNATVVLVRTRGLWGSMYSYAPTTASRINLAKLIIKGFFIWMSNLFVFAPRRRVSVILEAFPQDQRPEPTREALNPWLEKWFNADLDGKPETPTFVPHHFLFGKRRFEFPHRQVAADVDVSKVKTTTKEAIATILEERLKRPLVADEQAADTPFTQLGLDSIDAMDVALVVERQFGFSGTTVPAKVGDLWALAEGLQAAAAAVTAPPAWFIPPADPGAVTIEGDTIPAAILNRAIPQRRDVIVADDRAGAITYERLIAVVGAMAKRFRDVEGANIGLMLPASVACDIAFVALHFAGKLPVLLNWTTGPSNLAHAAEVMGLKRVITSKLFIDRTQIEVPGTTYLFLEDLRGGIGKLELLRRLLAFRFFPKSVQSRLLADIKSDPDAPAVVLFTSGSEKAPKAVPLTHTNILCNQIGIMTVGKLTRDESLIGILPMFHSFGLTVTGMLPLVTGVRVLHHPDPTDAAVIVQKIAAYKPTLLAATPTFLGFILERAKPGDLDSLRLAVIGAEKCPPATFEKAKRLAPNVQLLEGYGITECSPVVSVNRPGQVKPGTIGDPLPGVEICVVDLETEKPVPPGTRGMLLVTGPTVFPGYIANDGPSPFREMDGKRWYVTGDLVALDDSGAVVFHGRLKRFLKAGGEMISLPALEEPFTRQYPATDQGPRVAVEGIETHDGRRVVLFTTEEINQREANALLQKEGFRGVMRLDEVRRIDAIPVLGTGKTDYKVLRAQIDE